MLLSYHEHRCVMPFSDRGSDRRSRFGYDRSQLGRTVFFLFEGQCIITGVTVSQVVITIKRVLQTAHSTLELARPVKSQVSLVNDPVESNCLTSRKLDSLP